MSHRANTTWVRYRLRRGRRARAAAPPSRGALPQPRRAGVGAALGDVHVQRHRRPLGAERARRRLARAQAAAHRRAPRAHARDAPGVDAALPDRGVARLRRRGAAGLARPPARRSGARRRGHAGGLDGAVGGDRRARPRRRARRRARAPPAPARHRRARRQRRGRRRADARRRSVHHHPRRPRRRPRARPRRRRRGAHRDRRLPLVHRLGPRHHDLARRPHARHRPHARGRRHPAHLRAATSATGSSPTTFPTGRTKGSTTPPTPRFGSSTPSTATSPPRGDRQTLRAALADAARHHRAPPRAARASASASIPPTACLRQGADGYQLTWMDAKVDGWVVTPRRGKAVEINALWYNALAHARALAARGAATATARRRSPATPSARGAVFNARFWCAARG